MLISTRKFSSKKPESLDEAFNNVINYCQKITEREPDIDLLQIYPSILSYIHQAYKDLIQEDQKLDRNQKLWARIENSIDEYKDND